MSNKIKQRFKMTNELDMQIMEICKALPPVVRTDSNGRPVTKSVLRKGSLLLSRGDQAEPGIKIHPEHSYRINELLYVDHRAVCNAYFEMGGMDAVRAYEKSVYAIRDAVRVSTQHDPVLSDPVSKDHWFTKATRWIRNSFQK